MAKTSTNKKTIQQQYRTFGELTQAEKQLYNTLQTLAGQRLLKTFQDKIDSDKVQLTELRSQLSIAKSYAYGSYWTKDKNTEVLRKIDGQYNIVTTDNSGVVKSIMPLRNGQEISLELKVQLQELDNIDYQMFMDGCLQNTQINTREFYETRAMLTDMPLDYINEYTLRTPINGQLPKVSESMQKIADQFSEVGRQVAKHQVNRLEIDIDRLEVATGEKTTPLYNENMKLVQ